MTLYPAWSPCAGLVWRTGIRGHVCVRERPWLSRPAVAAVGGLGSGEQVVGQADLGAVDEGAYLVGFQDECGAAGVGGLAQRDPAARELFGFQAGASVVAPRLVPAVFAEAGRGHAV